MTKACNVLVTSAGRRVSLLEAFRSAIGELGIAGRVLAADQSRVSSAFHRADVGIEVPPCSTDEFIPALLDVCATHDVRLVVPTIDTELGVLSAHRDRFAALGTTLVVSGGETIAIAADKVRTHEWLARSRVPTVRQTTGSAALAEPAQWQLPLIVKPRHGSASHGVFVARDREALELLTRDADVVVQTIAPGLEHTVDVLIDGAGRVACAVPRRRLEVRGGEVMKALTVRCAEMELMAQRVCEALPDPFGPITVQMFFDDASRAMHVIEVNPRFGGGFPLSFHAGANYPKWILEDVLGRPSTAAADSWRDGLVMLRYDEAVFIDAGSVGL